MDQTRLYGSLTWYSSSVVRSGTSPRKSAGIGETDASYDILFVWSLVESSIVALPERDMHRCECHMKRIHLLIDG